jgi:hypothetical protein
MIGQHCLRHGGWWAWLVVLAGIHDVSSGPVRSVDAVSDGDGLAFFETRVRPVLVDHCYSCHSAQAKPAKGDFRLDTREGLLQGGESGKPALVPGDAEKSRLIEAVRYRNADFRMPPKGKLPDDQIADLVKWVNGGALGAATRNTERGAAGRENATPPHWAFVPVKQPPVPNVKDEAWPITVIDRFILAKLEENGLKPVADADKPCLIRRATFDLIGLPPTPAEVDAFLNDSSPEAFARVVDRLLASERYGERWGRFWMDVVRYADTAGDNADYPIPEARLYRDYIIDSFNADKPYDQFVQEQLAGDILSQQLGDYDEPVIATGFLALSRRYATAPFELWHLTIEDTIETTGRAFMGLTLRCARCHDHKYDPVTKEDYYGLYGFFASTQFPYAGSEELQSKGFPRSGFIPLVSPEQAEPMVREYRAAVDELQQELKQARQTTPPAKERIKQLETELSHLQRRGLPAGLPAAYAVAEGKPTDECVQIRGEPEQRGPLVKRRFPKFLAGDTPLEIPDGASGRLQLAQWLTRKEHPLTARVMVNRIWQHHFGKGIVATPSNFGRRGEPPTHPELLDYLASQFVNGGWSIKAMHRLIMSSRCYQLSSVADAADASHDPANRFLWHAERRRLEAEAVRDAMLAVAGRLDLSRPGAHPFPPIEAWNFTQHSPFKAVYGSEHRSVYLMTQRIQRHPFLSLFDAPDANTSTDVRPDSTVPLQALFMMNDRYVGDRARALGERLLAMSPEPRDRIEKAIALLYSREATPRETSRALAYLEECRQRLIEAGAPLAQLEVEAWSSYARVLLSANEFIYID